jgi:ribosomal protein S18 acetylase RimI-like enzyme
VDSRRSSPRPSLRWGALFVLVGLIFGGLLPLGIGRAAVPTSGTNFTFQDNYQITNGGGNYSGYSESQNAQYHYTVLSIVGDNVTVNGSGSYQWTNSTSSGSGNWAETFAFSAVTRLYTSGFDVLGSYPNASVWFWIPTGLSEGQGVRILDTNFTVVSLASTVWLTYFPPVPRIGVELMASGSYTRDDVYGVYTATFTDRYWFDPTSGFVIGEYYTEQDNGAGGSFDYDEQLFVTQASYPLPLDYVQLVGAYVGLPAIPVGAILSVRWYRSGPRRVRLTTGSPPARASARRVRRLRRLPPKSLPETLSASPFLVAGARRALALKNPFFVAQSGDAAVGSYLYDPEIKTGAISASDPGVVRTFLSMRRPISLFLEFPPGVPVTLPKGYTEIDRLDVFELHDPKPVSFVEPRIVPLENLPGRRLDDLFELADEVYGFSQRRTILQALADGDLAYELKNEGDGGMAGFAFAMVDGDDAMLYGLTIRPGLRGLGLGNAFTAARLSTLAALGVKRVRVEISKTNFASRRIARRYGFVPVGEIVFATRKVSAAFPLSARPPMT